MNIRNTISAIFILGYFHVVWSQTTGKIVDTNQQPVEGATIVMQLPDSTYLGATISAADGTFMLEPEPENYQLIVQHLLYQTRQVQGQARDAGVITLESKDYNLEEVVIEPRLCPGCDVPFKHDFRYQRYETGLYGQCRSAVELPEG